MRKFLNFFALTIILSSASTMAFAQSDRNVDVAGVNSTYSHASSSAAAASIHNAASIKRPEVTHKNAVKWANDVPTNANVGDVITLSFTADVSDGFAITSINQPPRTLIKTEFKLSEESQGVELVGKLQESGTRVVEHNETINSDVAGYKHTVTFTQKVKITAANPKLKGVISYQTYNEKMGFPHRQEVNESL
jgi:hypothetical protein